MTTTRMLSLLMWLAVAAEAASIAPRGDPGPENTSGQRICTWSRPQSGLVRDKIYLDGGLLQILPVVNGQVTTERDFIRNPPVFHSIDLKKPFKLAYDRPLNTSTVIESTLKSSRRTAPLTYSGHMLYNDYGFISYGGAIPDESEHDDRLDIDEAGAFYIHKQGDVGLSQPETWRTLQLNNNVTRGLVQGAYTSAPSEDCGWIFGGSQNEEGGEIRALSPLEEEQANEQSNFLVSVDMSTMGEEKWTKTPLPKDIAGRSQAELAWLPVSEQGALVVIGGTSMTYQQSEQTERTFSKSQVDKWEKAGDGFMKQVQIYDPATETWYTQNTTGTVPPATADFCSVVASTESGDSHQIFIYGGYSGLTTSGYAMKDAAGNIMASDRSSTRDTVYVLSIPSFEWSLIYESDAWGRRAHRCHKVADNIMLVVGGISSSATLCTDQGILRSFNLNTAKFEDEYHPDKQSKYEVPKAAPADMDDDLKALLTAPYKKKVKNYWPFDVEASTNDSTDGTDTPSTSNTTNEESKSSGLPSYVPPLLGAILGLLVLGCILAAVLYYLRRKRRNLKRLQSDSAASTVVKKRQTWSWLMNTRDGGEKGSLHEYDRTSNTEPGDPFDRDAIAPAYASPVVERTDPLEVPENQIYEMAGSNSAQELPTPARTGKTVTINDQVQEIGHHEPISPLTPQSSVNHGVLRDPTRDTGGPSAS